MVEYTLLEKIKTVFNLIYTSPLFLILLLGISLMVIDILFISKKDSKTKIVYGVISIVLIFFFMYSYLGSLLSIFDTIAKNIVAIIYFPSVLEYILMLLISLIILIVSVVSKKMNKIVKRINLFVLIINSFLFFLILDQIAKSNVDLTNKISVYTNSTLMILLELSIIIFAIWITVLILYKIIKVFLPKESLEKINLEISDEKLDFPKTIEETIKLEKEEMFSLKEYRQMKALLESMKENESEEK